MGKGVFRLVVLLAMVGACCCWWGCPPHELTALNNFKLELFDPYELLASWKGLYCCSWRGITCDMLSGHVVRMDFSMLESTVPMSLLAIPVLLPHPVLSLVRNLSSQIFPALFELQHLEYLDLSWIDLSPFSTPSRLSSLNRLRYLSLKECELSGPIPNELGNMSSLEFLDISHNFALGGPIPNELGNMSSLKFLDVSGNSDLEMRQSSSWIRNLRGLEHLGVAEVNLTIGVVENVASLPNLTSLVMSRLPSTLLSPLANLTSLSHLYLYESNFTQQPFPIWISNLTSLVSLSLKQCDLLGSVPSAILSLPHLRTLGLSKNPRLKVNLSFIVQHAFQLNNLYIKGSNVGGVIPNTIGNMSSLTALYLNDNNIEGSLPNVIGNLSQLEELVLPSNSLRGNIPWSSLGGLSKLSYLSLWGNEFNGSLPSTFGNLSSLFRLSIANNCLSGTFLLSQLDSLKKLISLDLSNNFLNIKVESSWIPKF